MLTCDYNSAYNNLFAGNLEGVDWKLWDRIWKLIDDFIAKIYQKNQATRQNVDNWGNGRHVFSVFKRNKCKFCAKHSQKLIIQLVIYNYKNGYRKQFVIIKQKRRRNKVKDCYNSRKRNVLFRWRNKKESVRHP